MLPLHGPFRACCFSAMRHCAVLCPCCTLSLLRWSFVATVPCPISVGACISAALAPRAAHSRRAHGASSTPLSFGLQTSCLSQKVYGGLGVWRAADDLEDEDEGEEGPTEDEDEEGLDTDEEEGEEGAVDEELPYEIEVSNAAW